MHYLKWNPNVYTCCTSLTEAYSDMQKYVTAKQQHEIPFIVQFCENPKYSHYRLNLFKGATTIKTHDLIHIILNADMSMDGEAYSIGYTMGNTKQNSQLEINIFLFLVQYIYPKKFKFSKNNIKKFQDGFSDGERSNYTNLHSIKIDDFLSLNLKEVRNQLNIFSK